MSQGRDGAHLFETHSLSEEQRSPWGFKLTSLGKLFSLVQTQCLVIKLPDASTVPAGQADQVNTYVSRQAISGWGISVGKGVCVGRITAGVDEGMGVDEGTTVGISVGIEVGILVGVDVGVRVVAAAKKRNTNGVNPAECFTVNSQ